MENIIGGAAGGAAMGAILGFYLSAQTRDGIYPDLWAMLIMIGGGLGLVVGAVVWAVG
jgi:hypothetical protein